MDSSKKHNNPSPQKSANCLSKLFFLWLFPFFKYGYQNNLKTTDIYDTLDPDKCESFVNTFQENWENQIKNKKGKKPSLQTAIFKTFAKSYSYCGANIFFQAVVIKGLQPIILAEYIRYFDKSKPYDRFGEYSGWILGSANVLLAFLFALLQHHSLFDGQRIGMRVRVALSSLVYRKVLKLSQKSLQQTPSGKLVNLLSNDLQRIDMCSVYLHYIWIMPLQAIVCFYIMYQNIGIATLAGFIALILEGIPLQGYLSRVQGILRKKIAEKTDFRVKLMNELVAGVKVIKMYAWEKYFSKVVEQARGEEIYKITQTSRIKGVTMAFMVVTERFGLYCCIIAYVLLGNELTAEQIFSCAQLFNSLQLFMCIQYPFATATYAEAVVSVNRIQKFLMLEENENGSIEKTETDLANKGVFLQKASATWSGSENETLSGINLEVAPGKLCCVVGSVGSGKSSLLQMILRELPLSSGTLKVDGNISYASQEPWLFVSSVRNNILFGQPYVKEKYEKVVRCCALETDFRQFPFGDKTIVEERGVSLSGGQRARINLARTVYADADIYLLDDPLSAVDTRVGKHLFEKCFKGYLADKTRILVTHQVQFLKQADLIVIIENGSIQKIGTYNEVSEQELSTLHLEEENEFKESQIVKKEADRRKSLAVPELVPTENMDEVIATGTIPLSTYTKYFGYGTSLCGFIVMIFLFLIAQVASNCGDLYLTYWVNNEENIFLNYTNLQQTESDFSNISSQIHLLDNNYGKENSSIFNYTILEEQLNEERDNTYYIQSEYMIIYSILMAAALLLTPIRSLNFTRVMMNASRNLHNKMFSNVLQAPMKFFDTNPSGRILTRFSNDMGIIDELIPRALIEFIQIFLVLIGILFIIFIKVPSMIVPALILASGFYYVRLIYLKTAQDVKRLEGVNRAPVFSHLIATFDGMTTIRASKAEEMVIKEFDILLDQHSGTWYLYFAANEIFGWILDILSTLFIAVVTYQFLLFEYYPGLTGSVGLTLSQSLILTGMLQLGVRQSAEVANNMTSVERVLEYTNLEKETDKELKKNITKNDLIESYKLISKWPEHGEIQFRNVYLSYGSDTGPVLKDVDLYIKPGQKVGVVGRTGAGKSSLISVLFRLTNFDGSVIIDGLDTKKVRLSDLRSKISIIPQEPVLFSATVRYNLDPFSTVSDAEIWEALEKVELKNAVNSLDSEIQEGGSNFSTGQRQLLCLARAIVRNNKMLVLDEATANVDPSTDLLIQKTIRKNFQRCTVITIAHRLNTIMDSDRVLVMDAGKTVEFAHPHLLLKDSQGYFTSMLGETGSATEEALRKIAEDHYCQLFFDDDFN